MKLILQLICIISSNPQHSLGTSFPQVTHLSPILQVRTTSKTPLLQTHQKHLFLNSESELDKSKEFNNQVLKVNRNFKCYILFLHEIIRASSLSITFVEFSFEPAYLTIVVKIFKFMKNYNSWKMYLQVKILIQIFYSHAATALPIPPIAPAVRTLLQVLSLPAR